jgi:hypothetical protein
VDRDNFTNNCKQQQQQQQQQQPVTTVESNVMCICEVQRVQRREAVLLFEYQGVFYLKFKNFSFED